MIKEILMASTVMLGGISTYKIIKYSDAPEAPIIRSVETNIDNPNEPINKLQFSSKVMDKNILISEGYNDLMGIYLNINSSDGNQYFEKNNVYEGEGSLKLTDTITNLSGNYFYPPEVESDSSHHILAKRINIPQKSMLSMNIRVKSSMKNGGVVVHGDGGVEIGREFDYYDSKLIKDAKKGDKELYVDNIDSLSLGMSVSSDKDKDILIDLGKAIVEIVKSEDNPFEGKIVLEGPIELDMLKGEQLKTRRWAGNYTFKEINPKITDGWDVYTSNIEVPYSEYYDHMTRGSTITVIWSTDGEIYIDDLVIGYANEVTLYRDGVQIYKGYDTEFEDRDVKDLEKPNIIENIQSSIIDKGGNNQIKVKFTKPTDNGSEYTYTATASFEGKESPISEPVKSVIAAGIDGYSYEIDTNPSTEPDDVIDLRETTITKEVPKDDNEYFIHIKAIDKSGNVSETVHKKIELQELTASLSESDSSIALSWEFTDEMESYNFKVFRKEVNGEFEEISNNIKDLTYIDNNVSDKEKPNTPSLKETKYNEETDTLDFIFNDSVDNGTTYSYYIEAYLDTGEKIATSNIVTSNVSSGLKGYSYKIASRDDSSLNDDILEITDNKISVPISNTGEYIHVKSIDNSNNSSDTLSIKAYDDEKPTIDLRLSSYTPTKDKIEIRATGQDNIKVKSIKLPNGVVVNDRTVNYEVNKNGNYEFTVYDVSGNSYKKSIEITNIDRTPPTIEFEQIKEDDGAYKIKVTASDGDFPVSHIILPDGQRVDGNTYTMTAEPNIMYEFTAYDMAGNFTKRSTQVSVMETKSVTSNLDVYIKSQNMLSLSLSTNNITFDEFSGIQDEEKLNALTLTVNSSLPYDLKAYLPNEIRGSRFNEVMDKRIFNIRANGQEEYQTFNDINTSLTLLSDQSEGNGRTHGIDLMLKGDLAYKKDTYKATVKFEVVQK